MDNGRDASYWSPGETSIYQISERLSGESLVAVAEAAPSKAMSSCSRKKQSLLDLAAIRRRGSAQAARHDSAGKHRGSLEANRRGHASNAAVRAVASQAHRTDLAAIAGSSRLSEKSEATAARFTNVRKSQREIFHTATTERVPKTYSDTMKVNALRESLLDDARRLSPISAVMHATKLRSSIVPRLFAYPIVWLVVLIYMGCAALARSSRVFDVNVFGDAEERDGAFSGASVLVTFMVVFYLGYCYSRHFEQYAALRDAMSTLVDTMINCRVCLNAEDTKRAYCYLNLMHATAYVGMTPVLNHENFLDAFIQAHDLAPDRALQERLHSMDIDHTGASSFNVCAAWLIQLFHEAHLRRELDGESYRTMHEEVLKARSLLNSLYAYQHQVIPFVYSHLVSLACFVYLTFLGIEKGARFTPDSGYAFGAAVPCASFFIALVTTLGLVESTTARLELTRAARKIESAWPRAPHHQMAHGLASSLAFVVGQAISDPFSGGDKEDFALPSFLNSCAKLTFHIAFSSHIEAPHAQVPDPVGFNTTKQVDGRSRNRSVSISTQPVTLDNTRTRQLQACSETGCSSAMAA